MKDDLRKVPSHETTYARLRDGVLFGHWAPGAPVTIQGLIEASGAGMTPVREAIRRLTAEGALVLQGNRRVVVPRLTPESLEQLAELRLWVEPRLAARALPHLSESQIAALAALDEGIDRAIAAGDVPRYLEGNHRFHFTLYAAAGAPILEDTARSLWLRFGPSLRVVAARYGTERLPDRHGEALAAMRAGQAAALEAAIRADIEQGIEEVRRALAEGAV
jgi:DNA-binding GntR family transcriptional regulator